MYFLEWSLAMGRRKHKPGSWFDEIQKDIAEENKEDAKKMWARGVRYDPDALEIDVKESRSELLDDNGSVYRKTDGYLDVCTYNDDKRGLLTLIFGALLYGVVPWGVFVIFATYMMASTGLQVSGDSIDVEAILVAGFSYFFLAGVAYVFWRFLFAMWHLEAFTMRRLVVRFNRQTRKVYLLRPGFLGGVKAYDWEMIDVGLPKNMPNHQGIGGMLVLAARAESTDNPHSPLGVDGAFLGLPSRDYQHLLSFWEYIRRFMEDGADAVPAPKRPCSKWPNPLSSMWTVSRLSLPGGFDLGRSFLWLRLALTPVFVIWGLGHYASLLLSYEGRFPKAIRQASGESELRSWLELLAYNLLPLLYTAVGLWLYYAWRHGLDWRLPLRYWAG
ncbi:DUF6708 domain-containing protein [Chromobacterium haemolyticum]|uniref:DUF6708 domain-containing protein n=1 Tax=Chromobacterium haemolyticum TaxID=394935 RepID=UPI0009DB5C27|nr:DUF6708 domain-containing protein [Chromobacterium haemolyticum]OQS30852.1 hypothetical protein B0T40_24500 [Chromobacterium haemolyticum]OQS36481.1 hypothetical protein B0T39_16795 [Chromobacterium haemolyticum]PTU71818.1 hypothetical protein DBB33_21375 [Chromobacterium haemolyticum]